MMAAETMMVAGFMATAAMMVGMIVAAMYEPKPVPYMDGHY